nr:hypothetical protein [Tanacetum cinerariifolium]
MGSLLLQEGAPPKFAQLYIYDTDNEIKNRARAFSNSSRSSGRSNSKHPIDRDIMNEVKDVLDTSSDLVKTFRRACDQYNEDIEQNIRIKLAKRGRDRRTYNLPTSNEVVGLIVVVLSSSFTGGPRYMRQNYVDAMALCRWREHNLMSTDRPDVLLRVFKMKLDQLMKEVKELHLFRRVQAGEIPDPNDDPDLYKLFSDFMMHGLCGKDDPSQACMVDRKCSKHFPKKFMQHSSVDSGAILSIEDCHINVEWCNQTGSIKYLLKYINKGPDRVSTKLYEPATTVNGEQIQKPVDKIKAYLDCRYLSACEQQILYDKNSDLETVLHKPSVGHSMFEDLVVSDEEKKNVALFYIEELMRSRGTTLRRWPEMPYPDERYISEFVGDGELGEANDGEVSIDVPEELLIDAVDDHVTSIIDFTYPNLLNNINNPSYFQEKPILTPTNEVVDTINDHLLNKFPGEKMVYLSCDSIDKTERGSAIDEAVFSPEFINGLKFSGVPNHRLALKVGVPIMLLRNIDQANGLCNGTRLQVLRLTRTYIQAKSLMEHTLEMRLSFQG